MPIVYNVFFNDASNDTSASCLSNFLAGQVDTDQPNQRVMQFKGCKEEFPMTSGKIIGKGIDTQCKRVVDEIEPQLGKGEKIVLNVYGSGLGGASALMLTKMFKNIPSAALEINLALLEPKTEDSVIRAKLNIANISLTSRVKDVRDCKPLNKVMALYTVDSQSNNEAPLFPMYPANKDVTIDTIPGNYTHAENIKDGKLNASNLIGFARFQEFLASSSTAFRELMPIQVENEDTPVNRQTMPTAVTKAYDKILKEENAKAKNPSNREAHSPEGKIIHTKASAQYFNEHHQVLKEQPTNKNHVLTSVEAKNDLLSKFNHWTYNNPRAWRYTKRTLFVLAFAGLVAASGPVGLTGLGAFIAGTVNALIGLLIWHKLIKPGLKKLVNYLLYADQQEAKLDGQIVVVNNPEPGYAPGGTYGVVSSNMPANKRSSMDATEKTPLLGTPSNPTTASSVTPSAVASAIPTGLGGNSLMPPIDDDMEMGMSRSRALSC